MKKQDFKKFALVGVLAGLCAVYIGKVALDENANKSSKYSDDTLFLSDASDDKSKKKSDDKDDSSKNSNDENESYHLMTEEELLENLNAKSIELYKSLSPEGKALVLKTASALCKGTNACSGLNACATEKNSCMGLGSCEGQGKCAIGDKNAVVKMVTKKMAEKRAKTTTE